MNQPSGKSWRLAAIGVLALTAWLFPSSPARAAAECPTIEKVESGDYCNFIAKDADVVHVWKSPDYGQSAAIVVYVHGDTSTTDATWASDKLAGQFRQSGVNGLFVVPRGPQCGKIENCADTEVRWEKLDDLLAAVQTKIGHELPTGPVVVIGHSNAIRTTNQPGWINDPDVNYILALDTLYADPTRYKNWLKTSEHHRIVLVGEADRTEARSIEVAQAVEDNVVKLDVPSGPKRQKLPDGFPPLTDDEKAKRSIYLRSPVGHHYMPENLIAPLLPLVLRGAAAAGAEAEEEAAPAAAAAPGAKIEIISPNLEVLIPGVKFTEAVLRDGSLTIPFIAQYIGGVYAFLLSIVGIVAAVMMMTGGFLYLTAGGDANRVKAGRKRIVDSLIGLALALGSYLLLYAINPSLVGFRGLQLLQLETVLSVSDAVNAQNEGGVIQASDESAGGVTAGSAEFPRLPAEGRPKVVCTGPHRKIEGVPPCTELCAMEKDTTVTDPDTGTVFPASTRWPKVTEGMADPDKMVKITGLKGVKSAMKTDPRTLELLRQAGAIASDVNTLNEIGVSGGPYVLHVTSGYRPLATQIGLACRSENGGGTNIGSTLANPGGSLHGAGFALDIRLEKPGGGDAGHCSGCSHGQQYSKYREASIKLVKIMFAAGFRRVNNEIWHFEPANAPAPKCRCYKIEECTFPSRAGTPYMQKLAQLDQKIEAAAKDSAEHKQLTKEWDKLTNVTTDESPIGCNKPGNYDNGAL